MIEPRRTLRYYKLKFIRLKGDPASLARGVALGVFIGITPTIPLHMTMIIAFSFVFRSSIIAGILASWVVSNPLTFLPQYYLSWKIGGFFSPHDLSWDRIQSVMDVISTHPGFSETMKTLGQLGLETILAMILGGCILAAPFTIASYFASYKFFTGVQKKRMAKRAARQGNGNHVL
ncbi:MAG: DUF2062 domain-containing protein [Proteobacteria bacterium]|nr:DUF2062 domain-containing protein [Pseudomonadota bacterium]MBU1709335.1 DUF2062 domain-containing protein [Pseudomonadota bacterium]